MLFVVIQRKLKLDIYQESIRVQTTKSNEVVYTKPYFRKNFDSGKVVGRSVAL